MKANILVIIPTRNRPQQLFETLSVALRNSAGGAHFMVASDVRDYLELQTDRISSVSVKGTMVEALTQCIQRTVTIPDAYDVVGMIGDDVRLQTFGWDQEIQNMLQGKVGIVYGRDGIQNEKLPTHPFVSTAIFNALGYYAPAGLKHYCYDCFLRDIGKACGFMRYCPDLDFQHRHHTIGLSLHDSTYQEAEQYQWPDRAVYEAWREKELPAAVEKIEAYIAQNCLVKLAP